MEEQRKDARGIRSCEIWTIQRRPSFAILWHSMQDFVEICAKNKSPWLLLSLYKYDSVDHSLYYIYISRIRYNRLCYFQRVLCFLAFWNTCLWVFNVPGRLNQYRKQNIKIELETGLSKILVVLLKHETNKKAFVSIY